MALFLKVFLVLKGCCCFWGSRTAARDEGGTGCPPGGEAARRSLAGRWWWRRHEGREPHGGRDGRQGTREWETSVGKGKKKKKTKRSEGREVAAAGGGGQSDDSSLAHQIRPSLLSHTNTRFSFLGSTFGLWNPHLLLLIS